MTVLQKPLSQYLDKVEQTECPGLITNAREWISEGWGLHDEITPEQLAAALLMEASTQDICVETGDSVPEYPTTLRTIAFNILRLAGHSPSVLKPKKLDLVEGGIYYSTKRSIESEQYGDHAPCPPWVGKLHIHQNPGGKVLYLYRFDEETGRIDDDSNATAMCGYPEHPVGLYTTLEEANAAYLAAAFEHVKWQSDGVIRYIEEVQNFLGKTPA